MSEDKDIHQGNGDDQPQPDEQREDDQPEAAEDRTEGSNPDESDSAEESVTPPSANEGTSDESNDDELAQVKDSLLRARADFENFKRRAEEERARTIQVSRTDVILDLLPVIDNFDRAFTDIPDEIKDTNWVGGVQAIKQQFDKVLDGLGIERVQTVGEPFDPELHEAIVTEDSAAPENEVTKEFEAGYRLGEQVIRHARVAVSSGQAGSKNDEPTNQESKEN